MKQVTFIPFLSIALVFSQNQKPEDNYVWKIAVDARFENKSPKEIFKYFELFGMIQQKLNFRYKVIKPMLKEIGKRHENGSYSGMFRQIVDKEADTSPKLYFIREDRMRVVDFSIFVSLRPVKFLLKRMATETTWRSIYKPFSFQVWLALFTTTVIAGLLLPNIINYDNRREQREIFWSVKKTYWYLFGTFINQGANLSNIIGNWSRFSVGIWMLSVVVLTSSYSGTLTSFMAASVEESHPITFEELADAVLRGEYSCGTFANTGITAFFTENKMEVANKLTKHMIEKGNYLTVFPNMLKRLMRGRFAAIIDLNSIMYTRKYLKEGKWFISDDALVTFTDGYILRKGFPYKNDIDNVITRLTESGIMSHRFGPAKIPEEERNDSEVVPLTIENLFGAVLVLIIGYTLSVVCFMAEIFTSKFTVFR